MRDFAHEKGIEHFYDVGAMGVEHALLPEKGLVVAGDLVIGADSHTCTYGALGAFSTGVGSTDMAFGMATGKAWFKTPSAIKFNLRGKLPKWVSGKDVILHIIGLNGVDGALYQSMEFGGDGVASLSIDDRLCICNMAIEAGGKNGIFPVDQVTLKYIAEHSTRQPVIHAADAGAEYERVFDIDLASLRSTVAFPHLPSNTKTFDQIPSIPIDQVVIGSCTNGRLSDLAVAPNCLKAAKSTHGCEPSSSQPPRKSTSTPYTKAWLTSLSTPVCAVSTPTCALPAVTWASWPGRHARGHHQPDFVGRMSCRKAKSTWPARPLPPPLP